MGQTGRVSGRATAVFTDDDGMTKVVYHGTTVVAFDATRIVLRSGGWSTLTTRARMNQASHQFRLGYSVYQRDYSWFVVLPSGETVAYVDGMSFPRA